MDRLQIAKMDNTATYPVHTPASEEIHSLNKWLLETIGPYVKGRTLEINSGTNSLCPLFIAYNRPIHLSDTNPSYLQTLRETYQGNPLVRAVHDFDLMSSDFRESHPETLDVFDTIIALNLPAADFGKMVENIKYVLPKGGTLVLILRAFIYIYHGLDQNLDDWKMYNKENIKQILNFHFSILKVRYFNLVPDVVKYFMGNTGLHSLVIVQND
jgi:hypothetical protein